MHSFASQDRLKYAFLRTPLLYSSVVAHDAPFPRSVRKFSSPWFELNTQALKSFPRLATAIPLTADL